MISFVKRLSHWSAHNTLAYALTVFGWLLVAAAAAIVVAKLYHSSSILQALIDSAVPAGVLLALAGHLFSEARAGRDLDEKRSKFYLEACAKAYEEVRDLLAGNNNDRAKWIAAGRALTHAKRLADNVTLPEHSIVLELDKLKNRKFFHEALASKPAAFFYGVEDHSVATDEAARLSTAAEKRAGTITTSTLHELSEKSLYAVWEAAQWPNPYDDPLGRTFSAEEKGQMLVLFPGLHEYLEHKEQWHSASGKLFPNKRTNL